MTEDPIIAFRDAIDQQDVSVGLVFSATEGEAIRHAAAKIGFTMPEYVKASALMAILLNHWPVEDSLVPETTETAENGTP